jgi:HlyD family secretion protein
VKSRRIQVLLIIAGVIVLALVGRSMRGGGAVQVETTQARLMPMQSSILASGELGFSESVELKPEIIGLVTEIRVAEGDHVDKGQVVIQLDPASFRARVDRQQALVTQQQTAIESQRLLLENMSRELERRRRYYASAYLSASDFESEATKLELAKVELSSRQSALVALRAELAQAQEDLTKTEIRAPMSGVVTRLSVRPGETVVAGTNIAGSTLLEIADTSKAIAVVYVDEAEIDKATVGATARVESASEPGTWRTGRVERVGTSVSNDGQRQGRRFEVRIALQPAAAHLRQGTSCHAEIITDTRQRSLVVPMAAVQFNGSDDSAGKASKQDEAYVFAVQGSRAKRVPVQLGISNDAFQEVTQGLKPGDRIVTGPYPALHHLSEGDSLRLASPAGDQRVARR